MGEVVDFPTDEGLRIGFSSDDFTDFMVAMFRRMCRDIESGDRDLERNLRAFLARAVHGAEPIAYVSVRLTGPHDYDITVLPDPDFAALLSPERGSAA